MKKKIKVFSSFTERELTELVNEFIENNKLEVVDIKFTTHVIPGAHDSGVWENWMVQPEEVFNAMIIYESEV